MNDNELVIEVLEEAFPIEVDLVGPTYLGYIVEGTEFLRVVGGNLIDLQTVIVALIPAATFIKLVLEIFYMLREKSKTKPSKDVITKEVMLRISVSGQAVPENSEQLIVIILHKLQ